MAEAVRIVDLQIFVSGAEQSARELDKIARAEAAVTAAANSMSATYAKIEEQIARQTAASTRLIETRNREAATARKAAESAADMARESQASIVGTANEVLELGSKLKTMAAVAYLTWPAFRNGINLHALPALKLLHLGLSEVAPVATAAGTAAIRSMSPVFALMTKLALPILALVVAWKALNALIGQGADLLEKYGNAGRRFDSDDLEKNFKSLTKFQDKDDVTLVQRQYAAELARRLDDAKFRLSEFAKLHLDVNDTALFFQKVWISIVETIARGADGVTKMIRLIGQAWDKLTSLGTEIGKRIGEAIRASLPENIRAALTSAAGDGPAALPKGDFDINSRARAMRIARSNLAAAMGVATAGEDDDAKIGGTFAARWNASINALKEGHGEVEKVKRGFDSLEKSMQRVAAVQEAEAKAVDASVGEHARLRAEMRLQESALQDIEKHGGNLNDYAGRIKILADRFGTAAQQAAELKLASDIRFTTDTLFLSDTEKQIASILRQVHGADWKNMMDSPTAAAVRFNVDLKDEPAALPTKVAAPQPSNETSNVVRIAPRSVAKKGASGEFNPRLKAA